MNEEWRKKLVLDNMKLVGYVVSKLCNVPQPVYDDALGEGYLALCKAANNYNPDLNISFSTYACTVIYRQMLQVIQNYNKYVSKQNLTYEEISNEHKMVSCKDFEEVDVQDLINTAFGDTDVKGMVEMRRDGYYYKEIGAAFDVSPETVSRRVKQRLRQHLDQGEQCELHKSKQKQQGDTKVESGVDKPTKGRKHVQRKRRV